MKTSLFHKGLLILSALVFSTALWARLDNPYVWITLLVTLAFGLIGFADDYAKVTKQNTKGVSGKVRMLAGLAIAALASYAAASFHPTALTNQLALPFFKDALLNLSVFFIPFGMFVIVGAANAVNLTDGLDGLAIMPVMIAGATLGVIAYVVGNYNFSEYLGVHFVPGTGELLIFTAALFGAGLGFLWYNAPPAAVFMVDTGALALGGALGAIAVCTKHEIVLAIVGGLFVVVSMTGLLGANCVGLLMTRYPQNSGAAAADHRTGRAEADDHHRPGRRFRDAGAGTALAGDALEGRIAAAVEAAGARVVAVHGVGEPRE